VGKSFDKLNKTKNKMTEKEMYNVAFRYTEKAGGYHGNVIWTSFESKEKFDEWYTDGIRADQKVVEEGISSERCMELVNEVPIACNVAACLDKATNSTGKLNPGVLEMELMNVAMARLLTGKKD